jgi:enediyne biosynthesis protein E4
MPGTKAWSIPLLLLLPACGYDPMPTAAAGDAVPPLETAAPVPDTGSGPRFQECAEKAGLRFRTTFLRPEQGENFRINLYDHGSGLAVGDFDGDGNDDVYLLNQLGPNALYRSRGDGTFEDVTAAAGVGLDDRISVAAAFGDADGDGDLDLYVTTVRAGNAYFENLGRGRFRDRTKEAGLELVTESMSCAFFDADGDGDLDLLVTNTARWTLDSFSSKLHYYLGKGSLNDLIASERLKNNFYLNDGKGTFTDATAEAGLGGKGWGGDIAVFDHDDDGDLDLFVCNMFGSSTLYRNEGKGRFADVTRAVLGKTSWGAMGARVLDVDGDARLDLLVIDMHSDMWMPSTWLPGEGGERIKHRSFLAAAVAMGAAKEEDDRAFALYARIKSDEVVFGNTLYRNKGGGAYEEISDRAGAETLWPWGVAEGDFDSDGNVDAFLPSGMGHPYRFWASALLRNRGDGTFENAARAAGLDPPAGGPDSEEVINGRRAPRSARAAATLDFDGDGRLDLVVNTFNDRALLYRNVSRPGHWCGLRLVATRTNSAAIGAVVRLTAGGRTQVRQVQAAGGYLSQSTGDLHFGLGGATAVDRVEIRWPGGQVQVLEKPMADARTTVTEPR